MDNVCVQLAPADSLCQTIYHGDFPLLSSEDEDNDGSKRELKIFVKNHNLNLSKVIERISGFS